MFKKMVLVIIAVALFSAAGCNLGAKTSTTTTTAPASVRTIRESTISKSWTMKQMEIDLTKQVEIVLKLKDGDRVDGYFYLVKGENVGFTITGSSLIYTSKPPDATTTRVTSDRFSFIAGQAQGIAYTLTLDTGTPADSKGTPETVFLEVIYPVTGSLLVPFGTK